MRDGGRLSAGIEVLSQVLDNRQPPKNALRHWSRTAGYAGAGDRAVISGLAHDALRRRASLSAAMDETSARSLILATAVRVWGWDGARLMAACRDDHGPGAVTASEMDSLFAQPQSRPDHVAGDFPCWLDPSIRRAFSDRAVETMQAMTSRAPVDVRVNALKTDMERARRAFSAFRDVRALDALKWGLRLPVRHPEERRPAPDSLPAFSRGWIEVQDLGSQIAAACVAAVPGEQVLDYCAGGGGKTLALAAAMAGRGQIHAYDTDMRRLSAIVPRLKRSGAHNVQICPPHQRDSLPTVDAVLVDAPCSGSGAWRRRPDTKWRLTPQTLALRCAGQDAILSVAASHVRPGGRLIYVTCSILPEENRDRVDAFLADHPDSFERADTARWAIDSGLLSDSGHALVRQWCGEDLALRLDPLRSDSDGFFIAALRRKARR